MNKIILVFISILLFSCSLNKNSKLWNKKDKTIAKIEKQKIILGEEKKNIRGIKSFTIIRFI